MGKKLKVLLAVLCAGLAAVAGFTGCTAAPKPSYENEGLCTEFSYHFGSYHGGYWEYDIYQDGEQVYLTAQGFNGVELAVEKAEVDALVLEDLVRIVEENQIYQWDGYSKSDDDVLDGYGFGLAATFESGRTLSASGYMMYPKGYDEGHKALADYLWALAKGIET